MGFSEHIDTILNRTELTRELLRKIQGLESRRDQEEGGGAGLRKLDLSFASVVPQMLCYGHCLCDSAPHSC